MEMILTGSPISAKEAMDWHILTHVYPRDKLIDETWAIAKKIAQHSQIACSFAKRAILASQDTHLAAGLEHERSLFIGLMNTHDKKEGVQAFLDKRPPKFINQ